MDKPQLKKDIANHFAKLLSLAKLNGTYLELTVGIGSAIKGNEASKKSLRDHMITTSQQLQNESKQIQLEIQVILN